MRGCDQLGVETKLQHMGEGAQHDPEGKPGVERCVLVATSAVLKHKDVFESVGDETPVKLKIHDLKVEGLDAYVVVEVIAELSVCKLPFSCCTCNRHCYLWNAFSVERFLCGTLSRFASPTALTRRAGPTQRAVM